MIGLIEGQGDIGKQLREIKASIEALKELVGKVRGSGEFYVEPDTDQTIVLVPELTTKCRVTIAPHNSWSATSMNKVWVQDISKVNSQLVMSEVRKNYASISFTPNNITRKRQIHWQ